MSGLEDAPWWVIAILVGFGLIPAATGQKAATLPGMLGASARWWQSRKERQREEARAQARAAADLSPSERVADKEIRRLELRYEQLADDCAEDSRRATAASEALAERVDKLEDKITATNRQFFILLNHHRKTVVRLQQGEAMPEIPRELRNFLP